MNARCPAAPGLFQRAAAHRRPAEWAALAPYLILALGPIAPLAPCLLSPRPASALGALFSARSLLLLLKSLGLAGFSTAIACFAGIGGALFLAAGGGVARRLLRNTYLLPLLLPAYVYAASWIALFDPGGIIAAPLRSAGLSVSPYGFLGTGVVLGFLYAPLVVLLVSRTLESVPHSSIDAARLMGGDGRAWREVLLPLALPPAVAASGMVLALVAVDFSVPSLLQWNVYAMEIFSDFSQTGDPARACWLSLPLVLMAGGLLFFSQRVLRRTPFVMERAQAGPQALPPPKGAVGLWAWSGASLLALSVLAPLGVLAAEALSAGSLAGPIREAAPDFARSLAVAGCAGLLAAICAWPAARVLARRTRGWLPLLFLLPLVLPAPLLGIAAAQALSLGPLRPLADGLGALVLAHAGRFVPLAVLAMASQIRREDPSLRDAARLAPARLHRRFLRIELPLAMGALVSAIAITCAFSLGEIGMTVLLVPPGMGTIAMRLFNLLHYGASATVALLALLSAAAVAAGGGAALLALRRYGR